MLGSQGQLCSSVGLQQLDTLLQCCVPAIQTELLQSRGLPSMNTAIAENSAQHGYLVCCACFISRQVPATVMHLRSYMGELFTQA